MNSFLSRAYINIVYFSMLVFAFSSLPLNAQNEQQNAEEYLTRIFELKRFSGMVLVANEQEVLMNKGFGMADYNNEIPFSLETKFPVAGLSEQFTVFITIQLLKEKGISLNGAVQDFLSDFSFPHAGKISFHHLLTHTSGLPDYPDIRNLPEEQFFSKEEMIRYFENVVPDQEPGKYFYSKLNYNLLGLLLESISKKPFEELLARYITNPLNMKNTRPDHSAKLIKNRAQGFNHDFADGWYNAPLLNAETSFAALGILSTTEDMLLWTRFIINEFNSVPEFRELLKSQAPQPGYGFQLSINRAGKTESLRGTGIYSSGFNADYLADPEHRLTVIVLCNNRNPVAGMTAGTLRNIFLNRDYDLPLPRKIVNIAPEVLEKYTGEYSKEGMLTLKIKVLKGNLLVEDGRRPAFEVFPQSDRQFFVANTDAEI